MTKNEYNDVFRKYVQTNLSPTNKERAFVTKVYDALQAVLGPSNCLQIGSYPRFTAITPLHDLDVLYRMGRWPGSIPNPASVLQHLKSLIEKGFTNPTDYAFRVVLQTHSITISFLKDGEEFFSIDVVPGYTFDTNEFGQDMYMVPEIFLRRHAKRSDLYRELARSGGAMKWIKSDPRGYIEVAKGINDLNGDFRKAAKLIKSWKWSCQDIDEHFKIKSFHIEQVVTQLFRDNLQLEIYDTVLHFFRNLHKTIERSQIPDRADGRKSIDEYVDDLTQAEKQAIIQARDLFLRKLTAFTEQSDVGELIDASSPAKPTKNNYSPAAVTEPSEGFAPRSPWASEDAN